MSGNEELLAGFTVRQSGITHADPGAQLTYAEYTSEAAHPITADLTVGPWKLISTVADGTTPMTIASTTLVSNLNADTVDGYEATELAWPAVIPSDDLRVSDDAEKSTSSSSYVKMKEILILRSGGWRTKFELKCGDEDNGWATIYRNGVAVGTERLRSTAAWSSAFEEDLAFAVGDLCQLWGRKTLGSTIQCRNFRLYAEPVYEQWGVVY